MGKSGIIHMYTIDNQIFKKTHYLVRRQKNLNYFFTCDTVFHDIFKNFFIRWLIWRLTVSSIMLFYALI